MISKPAVRTLCDIRLRGVSTFPGPTPIPQSAPRIRWLSWTLTSVVLPPFQSSPHVKYPGRSRAVLAALGSERENRGQAVLYVDPVLDCNLTDVNSEYAAQFAQGLVQRPVLKARYAIASFR